MADNTKLIKSRLAVMENIMTNSDIQSLYLQSDMMIFAMYALNVAEGVSTQYFENIEHFDIGLYIQLPFDEWIRKISQWQAILKTPDFQLKDDEHITRFRAKRMTALVYKLCNYKTDLLPQPSIQSTTALDDTDILEPFKEGEKLTNRDIVAHLQNAIKDLNDNLVKLYRLPNGFPDEKIHTAISDYLEQARKNNHAIEKEELDYEVFCEMPGNLTIPKQLLYLRKRLKSLAKDDALSSLVITESEVVSIIGSLGGIFFTWDVFPPHDQYVGDEEDYADRELLAKLMSLVDLSDTSRFHSLDEKKVFYHLTRNGIKFKAEEEHSLQCLFALLKVMQPTIERLMSERQSKPGKLDESDVAQIQEPMSHIRSLNGLLVPALKSNKSLDDLNGYFERLFSSDVDESLKPAQRALINKLTSEESFEKTYIFAMRQLTILGFFKEPGFNTQNKKNRSEGKPLFDLLRSEDAEVRLKMDNYNSFRTHFTVKEKSGDAFDSWTLPFKLFKYVSALYKEGTYK